MQTRMEYTVARLVAVAKGDVSCESVPVPAWFATENRWTNHSVFVRSPKHARRLIDRLSARYQYFRVHGTGGNSELLRDVWSLDGAMYSIGAGSAWQRMSS